MSILVLNNDVCEEQMAQLDRINKAVFKIAHYDLILTGIYYALM